MDSKWNEVIRVALSVILILLVAVLQRYSKLVAAVTATMPITIPLSLWIIFNANKGDQISVERFTRSMVPGITATLAFVVAVWLGTRAGLRLLPVLALGYTVWGVMLLVLLGIQRLLGF